MATPYLRIFDVIMDGVVVSFLHSTTPCYIYSDVEKSWILHVFIQAKKVQICNTCMYSLVYLEHSKLRLSSAYLRNAYLSIVYANFSMLK